MSLNRSTKKHLLFLAILLAAGILAVILMLPAAQAQGGTIYVKSGSGGSGTSWSDAYGDLQSALDDAGSGDEIWVAAGAYFPSTERGGSGDRFKSFQMKNGVALYGGFPATGSPVWSDRDWQAYETILSGEIGNSGTITDNCYHVFYHPDNITLSNSAIMDGFTITRGYADGGGDFNFGGGMYNNGDSTTCEPVIINCVFSENNAATYGGAMYNAYASPVISNCTFYTNTAGSWAGAVMAASSSEPVLTNCVLTDNAATFGGAMYIKQATGRLVNCILWDNSPNNIHIYFMGSTADVTYCDSEGDSSKPWFGTGCIDSDPLWVNPGSMDFHLSGSSPCINAGTNSAANLPDTDFDGDPRIMDGIADIGVDEYGTPGVTIDIYVNLQGSNRPCPEGWQVPITVGFFEPGDNVLLDTPIYSFSGTATAVATASGTRAYFQCPDPVAPGTYDITADSATTLLNVKRNVFIE